MSTLLRRQGYTHLKIHLQIYFTPLNPLCPHPTSKIWGGKANFSLKKGGKKCGKIKNSNYPKQRSTSMKNIFANISVKEILLNISSTESAPEGGFNISSVYLVTTILSLMLLFGYYIFVKNKNKWLYLMFSSVCIVNAGYFIISVSKTLDMALWGNRLSYLGSVFLPLSMFFTIMNLCNINYKRRTPIILLALSGIVFLITATPGFSDIYYKAVTLEIINGVSTLDKTYGILHPLYMVYLAAYYCAMLYALYYSSKKKKTESSKHILIIVVAVTVNLFVWFLEQLVAIDFEFLSVSYIISELFLLSIFLMIEETERNKNAAMQSTLTVNASSEASEEEALSAAEKEDAETEALKHFASQLNTLTPTERVIYGLYVSGKSTKEVLSELNITENTLKYHNKNIYGKLGVPSRKVLIENAKLIENNSI